MPLRPLIHLYIIFSVLIILICLGWLNQLIAEETSEIVHFDIKEIRVTGNNLIPDSQVQSLTSNFLGVDKSIQDVEKARQVLENAFRKAQYPTVTVNIPPQDAADGIIELLVLEGRINHVRITGNRYYTMGKIARDLPIFAPGELLYLPDAKKQLNKINMNPDLTVKPILIPGKKNGTVDVELKVTDKLPLHGSLEINNRSSANTTDLRVNGVIHYDNLWQREHSLSFQYQVTPEDTEEVQAMSMSYLIHAPWKYKHLIAAFAVISDSEVAFGDGFLVKGKGAMGGIRYVIPLEGSNSFVHNATLGMDYKRFGDKMYQDGDEFLDNKPAPYVPLSFSYQGAWLTHLAKTTVNGGLTLIPRGLAMDEAKFESKRYKTRANPVVLKLGMECAASLPKKFGLNLKIDGQVTDQPLISNEQFSAGGMESVRGYYESELTGDLGIMASLELATPELVRMFNKSGKGQDKKLLKYKFRPYVFYDLAYLTVKVPLPDEEKPGTIQGTGFGFRGFATRHVIYDFDWAWALNSTSNTEGGDQRINFRVKLAF